MIWCDKFGCYYEIMKQFIFNFSSAKRWVAAGTAALFIIASSAIVPVSADTAPPAGTPATVSADALPTVQINGIVWAQVTVGDTVYATGRFTQARPAGVAAGGVGSVTRTNLVAFDINTGVMTSFNHSLNGTGAEGRAIAASPDGTKLFVGGKFSSVDGQSRSNFAIFNLVTNTLTPMVGGPTGTVKAVAATDSRVYVGGSFTSAGGQTRNRLAAYDTVTGLLVAGWNPSVTNVSAPFNPTVSALVVAPAQNNLIIGGYFNRIGGATYYSTGAVKLDTGALVAWASQNISYPIRDQLKPTAVSGNGTAITSLSTDGVQAYLTSYAYVGVSGDGTFEGRAAINPANGNIIWLNDCHGDSYSAFPIGQVLYSAGHPHDCQPAGAYPETSPQTVRRAMAETTYVTGVNGPRTGNHPSFQGRPRGTQLNWYPTLNTGKVSGAGQAAWSVTGNSSYVSYGGEFSQVQGRAQQGLVRFAIAALVPNKVAPVAFGSGSLTATLANSNGQSIVTMKSNSDPDNVMLTYRLYRNGSQAPLATWTKETRFWISQTWTYTDSGIASGTKLGYTLTSTDPFGNVVSTTSPAASQ